MNLDDKFKEIEIKRTEYIGGGEVHRTIRLNDEEIAQIKQLFADVGYRFNPSLKEMAGYKINTKPTMTGQEFFERFEKELGEPKVFPGYGYDEIGYEDDHVLEAAKKASGLDDK